MKLLSEELDDTTLKFILNKITTYAYFYGNCSRCFASITGTHYDYLRGTDRICQVCKMLNIPRSWEESD